MVTSDDLYTSIFKSFTFHNWLLSVETFQSRIHQFINNTQTNLFILNLKIKLVPWLTLSASILTSPIVFTISVSISCKLEQYLCILTRRNGDANTDDYHSRYSYVHCARRKWICKFQFGVNCNFRQSLNAVQFTRSTIDNWIYLYYISALTMWNSICPIRTLRVPKWNSRSGACGKQPVKFIILTRSVLRGMYEHNFHSRFVEKYYRFNYVLSNTSRNNTTSWNNI